MALKNPDLEIEVRYLKNSTESAVAEIFDVNDIVPWIFEFLQAGIYLRCHTMIGRVFAQLVQIDFNRLFLL